MNIQVSPKEQISGNQNDKSLTNETSGTPMYFAVSPLKLVVMSVCTMGGYELYWFYRNWVLVKNMENTDISPF